MAHLEDPLPYYVIHQGKRVVGKFENMQAAYDMLEALHDLHPSREYTLYQVEYVRLEQQVMFLPGM